MNLAARDNGFTLFEMMVTLAILGLITGIGYPQLQRMLGRRTMTEARGALALAVARARSEAIRRDMRVLVSSQGDRMTVSGITPIPLPDGARVEWPRNGVTIFGDGSSSGAIGTVRAGSGIIRFTVDPSTARLEFPS